MIPKTTLENGLRVLAVPVKGTRAVTVLVLVGTGAKYETKQNNGISHFLEHMFFKGTSKRPNKFKIAETLDRIGGTYNAFTGRERTGFWAKVDSRRLDLALDWISDIFLNSKFESEKIEKEKGVILEELNTYLDLPLRYIQDLWEKLLYGDQPAGRMLIGSKQNIGRFTRKDLLNYFKSQYSSQNTIVCVAGDIDSSDIPEKIEKSFSDIGTSEPKPKPEVKEDQKKPQVLLHSKDTDQTHICLGVRGYDLFHPHRYPQAVISALLGGFMSSRLFISIREKEGLAYYIKTSADTSTDTGYLVTQLGVDPRNASKAINLVLKEYRSLKEKKISSSELKKVKGFLKGKMTLALESSDAQASFYSNQELLTGEILTPLEKFKKIEAVTLKDVEEVSADLFQPSKLNLALIGPHKKKKKFQSLLKI